MSAGADAETRIPAWIVYLEGEETTSRAERKGRQSPKCSLLSHPPLWGLDLIFLEKGKPVWNTHLRVTFSEGLGYLYIIPVNHWLRATLRGYSLALLAPGDRGKYAGARSWKLSERIWAGHQHHLCQFWFPLSLELIRISIEIHYISEGQSTPVSWIARQYFI